MTGTIIVPTPQAGKLKLAPAACLGRHSPHSQGSTQTLPAPVQVFLCASLCPRPRPQRKLWTVLWSTGMTQDARRGSVNQQPTSPWQSQL